MLSSAVTAAESQQVAFPLRLADSETFRRVLEALKRARFQEDEICRMLGINSIADFAATLRADFDRSADPSDALALLTRLFLFVQTMSGDEVAQAIDRVTIDALLALDLLRSRTGATGAVEYYSPVLLYPVAGMIIASDRLDDPDGMPIVPPPDAVFPAIFAGTLRFIRVLPRAPAGDVLDLCAGTGIGALLLSQHAGRAVAADITPRAAHFARFNARLNGRDNIDVVTGDLYEAVAGRTFDRVIAHPPYMPADSVTQIFRDGGETGETLLQRIVAGLPEFLRPGGTCFVVCAAWDTKEGPFENRVRQWLGSAQEEFDLLFAVHHEMSPTDVARDLAERASGDLSSQLSHWQQRFSTVGVERRVYGALILDRRTTGSGGGRGPGITRRLRLSALTDGTGFERVLQWLRWREERETRGELTPALMRLTPRLSAHTRVNVAYVPQSPGLAVADVILETDRPFTSRTRIDPWMLPLLPRLDGVHTAEQVYRGANEAAELAEGFGPADFIALLSFMMERGYLEVDEGSPGRSVPAT